MVGEPRTLDALARMNREIDIRHVLPAIRVPTLLLHGTEDRIVPMEAARWMADRIPGPARLVSVSASHMHFGRGTDAMNAEVRHSSPNSTGRRAGRHQPRIGCSRRCCSRTSWTPAGRPRRSVTGRGGSYSSNITRSCE